MFDIGSALVNRICAIFCVRSGLPWGGGKSHQSGWLTPMLPRMQWRTRVQQWELSVDRANASRRELVAAGMPDDKLARVVGLSSTDLLLHDEPRAPQNRRITITVLTHEAEERLLCKSRTLT